MKLRILFTTALLMATSTICMAKEAYAVYDPVEKSLTFYYDNDRANYPTEYTYDMNTGSSTPGWKTAGIKKVEFSSSFANYKPTSTYQWFYGQSELTSFTGLSYLNTDNVTSMAYMFYSCKGLTSLDVSKFNTGNVTDMSAMFSGCKMQTLDLSNFNTSKVKKMSSMFSYALIDNLILGPWDTSNVETMYLMFSFSSVKSLDLSSFNTTKVSDFSNIFYNCAQLKTIYGGCEWVMNDNAQKNHMFLGCTSLVGGEGSAYTDVYDTSVEDDSHFAHVDGGESYPGFFTKKNYGLQVSGRDVTSMNYNNILGNASASYDPRTHTLTLNGGTFGKTRQAGVYVTENFDEGYSLNITVHGKNIMNSAPYYGITSYRTLWIEGNGSIEGDGINLEKGDLWLNDCQINVSSITAKNNSEERQYLWMQGKQAKISLTNNILWFDNIILDDDDGFVFLQPEYGYYDIEDKCVKDNYGQEAKGVVIASLYGISTSLNEAAPQIDNGQLTIDNVMPLYNLQGQRVTQPVKGSIYIQNGKKRIIK